MVDCCMLNSVPSGDKSYAFSPFPLSEFISNIDIENDLKIHDTRSLFLYNLDLLQTC